jgi:hypothetical protein
MEIRINTLIDIHFIEADRMEVDKLINRYLKQGYSNNGEDESGVEGYTNCVQLLKTKIFPNTPQ